MKNGKSFLKKTLEKLWKWFRNRRNQESLYKWLENVGKSLEMVRKSWNQAKSLGKSTGTDKQIGSSPSPKDGAKNV